MSDRDGRTPDIYRDALAREIPKSEWHKFTLDEKLEIVGEEVRAWRIACVELRRRGFTRGEDLVHDGSVRTPEASTFREGTAMDSIYIRGGKLWLAFKDVDCAWRNRSPGLDVAQEAAAKKRLEDAEARIAAHARVGG